MVTEVVQRPSIQIDTKSGADQMAMAFITKQREHLGSVRLLIAAGAHRDAMLITRTMVEGSVRLRWAFKKTPKRTEQWLWFGAIRDLRQLRANAKAGRAIEELEITHLEDLSDIHGQNYYRPEVRKSIAKAKTRKKKYQIPEDPWFYS
jgi:hypothetical protein